MFVCGCDCVCSCVFGFLVVLTNLQELSFQKECVLFHSQVVARAVEFVIGLLMCVCDALL